MEKSRAAYLTQEEQTINLNTYVQYKARKEAKSNAVAAVKSRKEKEPKQLRHYATLRH